ncbi:bifunctional protein-disulfide isomerase/oxidoreductase DsbC [Haemophilus paracuniculus]|uniref:Thiol:disulfide interchange protein n=1 Tax=Haemophilus paracuniculus TaxID=734 RepID=A0A1T0ARN6_9PAST|nr:bifunctional protein-disulfide isomerase/oxidoreductase DsbC [Haemophilus paracuniculus]OOR98726.1 bifunctional protein-disulfide isomerase/oxidoreductase DsbC [Haemophilus paracuniculus]
MKKHLLGLSLALVAGSAMANEANLVKQLEKMGANNVKISESPLAGFKTAISDEGIVQISNDGRYVIHGQIFELKDGKATDITNRPLLANLDAIKNEMITYPAVNQKYVVNVFMDITCGYCQMLHKQIKEYNDLGITLRFLAFPRTGLNSQAAKQMEAIWQAKDRNKALDDAYNGVLPTNLKSADLVKRHYQLGLKFGINGTPNIITEKGEMIAGYVEPKELLKMLQD